MFDDKEPTGICVLNVTFVIVSILLKNRPTNYYGNGQKNYIAEIFDMLLFIFIYYARRQHTLKYTDKNNINTNTKITKTYKERGSTNELQMAGNNELGKYLS